MSFSRLIGFAFLLWGIIAAIKVVFFKSLGFETTAMEYIYWLLIVVFTVALARRLGTINYLEAMLVAGFWFLISLIMDFIITSPVVGYLILSRWQVWVGYLVLMGSVFFFHKKRHVEIRHELASHQHGHH